MKKTAGFKWSKLVGTYWYTLGKICMGVPKYKAIHPNSLVFRTLRFHQLLTTVLSLRPCCSVSFTRSTNRWDFPFHVSFVWYWSPDILYLSFCRSSLFQGKLPWSEFFVLLFVFGFFSSEIQLTVFVMAFFQFLRPPSIPKLLYYIHNQYFISPLEKWLAWISSLLHQSRNSTFFFIVFQALSYQTDAEFQPGFPIKAEISRLLVKSCLQFWRCQLDAASLMEETILCVSESWRSSKVSFRTFHNRSRLWAC